MRIIFCIGCLLSVIWGPELSGQSYQLERPRIRNFSKSLYGADNQNWGIVQDAQGTMYFANTKGLLSFDGVSWKILPFPDKTITRSVEVDHSGRIYVGSYEEFGFWEKDRTGNMHYTSLKSLLKGYQFRNEDIWKIVCTKDIIYFQSFSVLFAYSGGRIEPIYPPGLINCFVKAGDHLYLTIADHGLYELKNFTIEPVDTSFFFKNTLIRVLLPQENGKILVATADKGIFLYDSSKTLTPWAERQFGPYKNTSINRGAVTRDGIFIIGTILNGVFAFNQNGELIFHLNKENGLQNNTVLATYIDTDGYLWLGLDNGIDLVKPGSNVTFYYDLTGKLGSVYTVLLHQGLLYAGTNQGLFYTAFEPSTIDGHLDFALIPNSQGQVWSLYQFDHQVLCGHNEGTFEADQNKIARISPVTGGFAMCKFHTGSEDYLLQSTYTNLVLYSKKNGKWGFAHTIDNFLNPVRYIEVDHLGNIWASHFQRGLYRIRLNSTLTKATESTFYGKKNGFASDFQIHTYRLENRIVFTNEGHVYMYNDLYDTIVRFDFIEEHLRKNSYVNSILPAGNQLYWFVTDKSIDLYKFSTGRIDLIRSYPFELFDNKLIQGYEFLYPLDSTRWIIGLENGIALIHFANEETLIPGKKAVINRIISHSRHENIMMPLENTGEKPPALSFSQNSLTFYYSCPEFDSKLTFYVKLDNIDSDWIQTEMPYYKYDRLPWGHYTFRVKAADGKGNVSQVSSWSFVIRSPWYWSSLSKILYLSFLVVLIILARNYILQRLKRQERRLSVEKNRELIKLRNEKLETEIHYKSMQLANTTYSIIKKNELLIEIKRLLTGIRRHTDPAINTQFRKIQKLLDHNITNEDDWKVFESNFEQAHEEFLKRIKKQYPDLTPSDLKLCAFIRMNLSSKKIAPLLGISIRGVENHRYRLRRKMGLDRDTNLTEYLIQF